MLGPGPEKVEIAVVEVVMEIMAAVLKVNVDILGKPRGDFMAAERDRFVVDGEMAPKKARRRNIR